MDEENLKEVLRVKQDELVKILEAFASLEQSKEWETLKELVFDRSLVSIERQLLNEASAPQVNIEKLYRLQGELSWAKKYSDLSRFMEGLKGQLENIKNQLK